LRAAPVGKRADLNFEGSFWICIYVAHPRTIDRGWSCLETFFRILGEKKVAVEDLDAKLREVAARHLTLLKRAEASPDDDPQTAALKKDAVGAIGAGDYDRAEELLERAFDADIATARRVQDIASRAQDVANKRLLTAAKTRGP
jgi:hypothetical protein